MRNYLLLFASMMLLLFAMPKNSSMRGFVQQVELKKSCSQVKYFGKKPCARKCLKHQAHPNQQNNPAGIASDCSQQVFAIVQEQHSAPASSSTTTRNYILPNIRKHLSPILEYDPEPPRLS